MKLQPRCPSSVTGTQPHRDTYVVVRGCHLHGQSWVTAVEALRPARPKAFSTWPFTKTCVTPRWSLPHSACPQSSGIGDFSWWLFPQELWGPAGSALRELPLQGAPQAAKGPGSSYRTEAVTMAKLRLCTHGISEQKVFLLLTKAESQRAVSQPFPVVSNLWDNCWPPKFVLQRRPE